MATPPEAPSGHLDTGDGQGPGFQVHLENFDGPFDLLLGLIAKHQLDVTEIALARVTDDFIAWIRAQGSAWDLDETSEFLLVAATLLDLKAARLLPTAQVEDEEDLALLEARDLLFARLLQYRAFKQVAALLADRMAVEGRRHPRQVELEPRFATLLPELVLGITPAQLAAIAAQAMQPRPVPAVGLTHLHAPTVSVAQQALVVAATLRGRGALTFADLVADAGSTPVVVARFLALLELFRDGSIALEQEESLGPLTVRWTGPDGSGGPGPVPAEVDVAGERARDDGPHD